MSQRKIIRNMFRLEGEKNKGAKPSHVVHRTWELLQIKRLGIDKNGDVDKTLGIKRRSENVSHGTHKKSTWKMRRDIDNGVRGI